MTAGNNGASENDDPFAYLYRSEGGEGDGSGAATDGAPVAQPGVPRTSYNQVQRVGERRPPQQGGYGYPQQQPQQPQQQPGYDQGHAQQQSQQPQSSQYAQQTQQTQQTPYAPHGGSGGGSQGPNRKGLLIGAIAVVVAVAIGIGFAMTGGDGKKDAAQDKPSTPPVTSAPVTPSPSASTSEKFASKVVDAAALALSGGAAQSNAQPGAKAAGGTSVGNFAVGATASYTFDVPKDGTYTLFISFGNVGEDAGLTLSENGKLRTNPVNMHNYMKTADWTKAWATTYVWVELKKGSNTLALTCAPGNKCGVNLDQVWMKEGQVKK
ncbi:carbohydrate-binding protein [Streptomyces sp. H39-S7]|uniref:carbohydrate-binding protein n=1 Tax=Streptomyces sp. H39-S7 TaxID=3004357 RepID=UPI0022AEFF14|nr:carbohydrate-binding protein [Streptomyces sp. H39-S7]MCZ4118700.1 carbohydrate-binding protein [Streptomyces sp. H39-S7]